MKRVLSAAVAGLVLIGGSAASAQDARAPNWEGMRKADWERFDEGWQAPGVSFRPYTKVMIEPAAASFRRKWKEDHNRTPSALENRISDEEVQEILGDVQVGLTEAFTRAARNAGYQVVTAPGPDVLQVKAALIDLDVHAPDLMTSTLSRTFAEKAGSGKLVLEIRDSASGALLAGGVDRRDIGDMTYLTWRTRVTNRADFSHAFKQWANNSMDALEALGAMPAAAG